MSERGGVNKAVLGIALTGVAVGLAWLAVGVTLGIGIGRAVRRADRIEGAAEPEVLVEMDGGPLLGVVLPRQQSFQH